MSRMIPIYELYGELLSGAFTDPIHHETIFERSSQNDWTIRLHRHARLVQVFLFRTAGVRLRIGEVDYHSSTPLVLLVPPETPHGFRFPEAIDGDVLSIPVAEIAPPVLEKLRQVMQSSGGILTGPAAQRFEAIDMLMRQIRDVYHSMGSERAALLGALTQATLLSLIGELRRIAPVGGTAFHSEMNRHELQAQAFCELVEAHFTQSMPIPDYARAMAVSPPHLTRVCRRILGTSPNELIRKRRMLEAKRLLAYTRLSVQDVAQRSGFADITYFSRTFTKTIGMTPNAFRRSGEGRP
ncbi:helix-turn-helix domain-containing protein (plasmid) [Thioclava sp. 'Guangxiensis']|uniref:helix-turn-helix domain-containing protein n=1 Tax=Thioclava sp. 'Guangxiensis' TaxID=3149044 RepID=UPI0032C45508